MSLWIKFLSLTIQMKATEQCFRMVLSFSQYFVNEIWRLVFLVSDVGVLGSEKGKRMSVKNS